MLATGGFPDCGEGRYAEKLSYPDWIKFNNAMRVHQNFVEQLPMVLTFLMFSGLILPKTTMIVGFVYATSRPVYSYMYAKQGGDKRYIGALCGSLPLYGLALTTFIMAI